MRKLKELKKQLELVNKRIDNCPKSNPIEFVNLLYIKNEIYKAIVFLQHNPDKANLENND